MVQWQVQGVNPRACSTRVGYTRAVKGFHLTSDPASKNPVDHGGLGELWGGLGATHADVALMHGIQQSNKILMGILLPPQPETAMVQQPLSS